MELKNWTWTQLVVCSVLFLSADTCLQQSQLIAIERTINAATVEIATTVIPKGQTQAITIMVAIKNFFKKLNKTSLKLYRRKANTFYCADKFYTDTGVLVVCAYVHNKDRKLVICIHCIQTYRITWQQENQYT